MAGPFDDLTRGAGAASDDPFADLLPQGTGRIGSLGGRAVEPIPTWDEPEVPDAFVMPTAPLPETPLAEPTPMALRDYDPGPLGRIDTIQSRTPQGRPGPTVRLPVPPALDVQQPPEMPDPAQFTRPVPRDYDSLTTGQRAGDQLRSGVETLRQGLASMGLGGLYDEIDRMQRFDAGGVTPEELARAPVPLQAMTPEQRAAYRAQVEDSAGRKLAQIVVSQQRQQQLASNPRARAMVEALNEGRYGDGWRAFMSDPRGIIQQFFVESLPISGAMAGAAITGGLLGGPGVGAASAFLSSAGLDFGPRTVEILMDGLRKAGVNTEDERAVGAYLSANPRLAVDAARQAGFGAGAMAAFDAGGLGAGAGIRRGVGFGANARTVGRNMGIELASEPAGEAAAQFASTGELKPGELAAELLGAGPQVVGTTAYGTLMEARNPAAPERPATDPAPLPAEPYGPAAPAQMGPLGRILAASPPNQTEPPVAAAASSPAAVPAQAPAGAPAEPTQQTAGVPPPAVAAGQAVPPGPTEPATPGMAAVLPAVPGAAAPAGVVGVGTPPAPLAAAAPKPNTARADLEAALGAPSPEAQAAQAAAGAQAAADRTARIQALQAGLPPGWSVVDENGAVSVLDPNGDWMAQFEDPPADPASAIAEAQAAHQEGVRAGLYQTQADIQAQGVAERRTQRERLVRARQIANELRRMGEPETARSVLQLVANTRRAGEPITDAGIAQIEAALTAAQARREQARQAEEDRKRREQEARDRQRQEEEARKKAEAEAEAAQEAAANGPGFTTAKGSTYVLHPDGTTTRNKAARPEHPGDQGPKARSARTVYVAAADVQRFAQPVGEWRVVEHQDGTWSLATRNNDGRWGISPSARGVRVQAAPSVGAHPLEVWNAEPGPGGATMYRRLHMGNAITELRGGAANPPAAPEPDAAGPKRVANADELRAALQAGQDAVTPSGTIYGLNADKGPDGAPYNWYIDVADSGAGGSGTLVTRNALEPWSKEQAIEAAMRHSLGGQAPKPAPAPPPSETTAESDQGPGEFGTPDAPAMVPLARSFASQFISGTRFASIGQARAFAAKLVGGVIKPNSAAAKTVDEAIEGGVVLASRQMVRNAAPDTAYYELVDLYGRQPRLDVRTGSSRERQAYSTPAPLAYLAAYIAAAHRGAGNLVWIEPTAGTGQLLVLADPKKVMANEIDRDRARFLREGVGLAPSAVMDVDATGRDWAEMMRISSADVVIANPPFGVVREDGTGPEKRFQAAADYTTTHIDHAIAARTLTALKDDGVAVLIVGAPVKDDSSDQQRSDAYRAGHHRAFWKFLLENYRVADHFTVAGALYERQGAAWPVDVIVIAGRGKTEGRRFPSAELPRIYSTWEDLQDALTVADRVAEIRRAPAGSSTGDVDATGGEPAAGSGASTPPNPPEAADPNGLPVDAGSPGAGDGGQPDGQGGTGGAAPSAPAGSRPGGRRPAGGRGGNAAGGGRPPRGEPAGGRPGGDGMAGAGEGGPAGDAAPADAGGAPGVAAPGDSAGGGDGDVGAAFDKALADVFGDEPPPAAAPPEPAPAPPTEQRPPRTAGEAAASAVKNAAQGADQAMAALTQLFGGGKRLGSGPSFDEETWKAAKPLFQRAAAKFQAAGRDIAEVMRLLLTELRNAYSWTRDMVLAARPYIERFVSEVTSGRVTIGEQATAPEADKPAAAAKPKENTEAETDLQVRYEPSSGAWPVGTLVPANQRDMIQAALQKLRDRLGDQYDSLDAFVAERLGYSVDEVVGTEDKPGYFSAEQVDAIALAIDNLDKGAGFIIGDQTGVGKGRFVAALLRYAKREGKVPIFVTKDPGLYGDMYRDTNEIGMPDFNAFVTNNDLRGKKAIPLPARRDRGEQEDGTRLLTTPPPAQHQTTINRMIETGNMPDEYDAVFTTYSQLQRVKGAETRRHSLMRAIAPNAMFVLDESHEAGGTETRQIDPDTGQPIPTRADFIRELVSLSHATIYSSATWAKAPHVVTLYSKTDMGLLADRPEDLVALVQNGGVPLQQIISNMLVQSGQYVRRERTFEGVAVNMTQVKADLATAERLAETLRAAFVADDLMEDVREAVAEQIAGDTGDDAGADNAVGHSGISGTSFASLMHNVISQGLLSLKVEETADAVIAALQAGQKPVIALSNTMGAFLEDYADQNNMELGAPLDSFTFNLLIERYVERMRRLTIKPPRGTPGPVTYRYITEDEILRFGGQDTLDAFRAARRLAKESDLGAMSASPIDRLIARIQEAGYKVGEITGRQRAVEYRNGKPYLSGREASSAAKKRAMSAFNAGQLDALVINRSGSTGFSLHAARTFKDQRQRRMFLLQPEPDINIFMQILGRIHRTGQVVLPVYDLIVSDLPIEKRPAAMTMKKLASLNANTTANRDSAFSLENVVDFLNDYGDQVVDQMLRDDPELALSVNVSPSIDGRPNPGLAARVTGRLGILGRAKSQEVYDIIEARYREMIETLDRLGQNKLAAKTLELDAKTLGRTELVPKREGVDTTFGEAATLEKVDVKRLGKPFTLDEIDEKVAANESRNDEIAMWSRTIMKATEEEADAIQQEIEAAQPRLAEMRAERDAMAEEDENRAPLSRAITKLENRLHALDHKRNATRANAAFVVDTLRKHEIGQWVEVTSGSDNEQDSVGGRIIDMRWSKKSKSASALSNLSMVVAIADAARQVEITAAGLHSQKFGLGVSQDPQSQKKEFIEGGSSSRETRYILTGNIPRGLVAISKFRGSKPIVVFRRADGTLHNGVLLTRGFNPDAALADMPVRFASPDQVVQFLQQLAGRAIVDTDDGIMTVQAMTDGRFLLRVKTKNGKPFLLNRAVRQLLVGGDFVGRRGRPESEGELRSAADAEQALRIYAENLGTVFQTTSHKDVARQVTGQKELTEVAEGEAKAEEKPGSPPLYANPLDPAAFKRFMLDPAMAAFRAAAAKVREADLKALRKLWPASTLPPEITVDASGRVPKGPVPVLSHMQLPNRMYRQWPSLAALVEQGARAEERMSIWSTRMGGRLDRILGDLKKAGGDLKKVQAALLDADANEVDIEKADVAAAHWEAHGLSPVEVRAAADLNRLLVQVARLVDQHRRAMLPKVRAAKAKVWSAMQRIADSASVPGKDYAALYRRRTYLAGRIRAGKGDLLAQGREVEEINTKLRALRAADPALQERLADLQADYDALEARLQETSVRRRKGYFPHKFFGSWRLFEIGEPDPETGEPTRTEMTSDQGFYDTQADAIAAAQAHLAENPGAKLRIEPRMVSFPAMGGGGAVLSDAAYRRLRTQLEESTGLEGDALNEALQGVARRRSRRRVLTASLLRKGAEGFSRDVERVMRTHIAQATRYVEMDKMKFRYVETTERLGLSPARAVAVRQEGMAEVMRAIEAWWRDFNGSKQPGEQQLDGLIEKLGLPRATATAFMGGFVAGGGFANPILAPALGGYLGFRMARAIKKGGDFPTRTFMADISSDMAHLKLGMLFNVASAVVNLTQTAINTYPVLGEKWTGIGIRRAVAAMWSQARNAGSPGRMSTDAILLTRADIRTRFSLAQDAPPLLVEDRGIGETVKKWSMMPFTSVETFNRAAAFLGAYARAEAEGKTPAQAMEEGRAVLRRTQFHQGQALRPEVLRNTLLRLPTQFKNFMAQQIGFVVGLKGKGEILRFVVGMFLVAGLLGLPGLQLFDWLTEALTDWSPLDWIREQVILAGSLGSVGGSIVDVLARGFPTLLGVDISQRVGMGPGFLPESGSDVAGPAIGTVAQMREAAQQNAQLVDYLAAMGGFTGPLRALEAIANGASITSARFWSGEAFGDGEARMTNPRKRDQTEYRPTDGELAATALGFRPLRQALQTDQRTVQREETRDRTRDQNAYLARIIQARWDGRQSEIPRIAAEARQAGVMLTQKRIVEAIKQAEMDRAQRDLKQAPRELRPGVMQRQQAIEQRFQ